MSKYKGVVFPIKIMPEPYFSNVTDIFGYRPWRKKRYPKSSGNHSGIDLGTKGKIGIPIKTPYDGTVTRVSYNVARAGNILQIEHDNGFSTRYLHLDSFNVKDGQKVYAGNVVAKSGNTDGSTKHSTGPHLHFEVWENNKKVDPAPYLYGYALEDGKGGKFVPSNKVTFNKKAIALDKNLSKIVNEQQLKYAGIIVDVCKEVGGTKRDAIIAVATALQESRLRNLNRGDRDSQGLFQQRPSQDWGTISQITDPHYSAKAFFTGAGTNKGLLDYKQRTAWTLTQAAQKVQRSGFPNAYAQWEDEATQIVDHLWGDGIVSYLDEYATEIPENISEEIEVDDYLASGIWQIVKVVIDPEVADKQINDASISMLQGSLYNFFEKVCQKPFVEFWGDTYGDQYYFIIRKPPFTKKSFQSLPTIEITEREVYSDSLRWENDQVYSWYQLIPNGNYIGGEELIFQYLAAVYFPEYGEIWGSRPLSVTTNYITFIKETGEVQTQAAIQDLKFLIDINSYLPFTRKGTITIIGDRRIKRGMRIFYEPTNEYFYVDNVSNNFSMVDGIPERTTTLQVSRGMIKEYVDIEIEDEFTPSYFNLINYGSYLQKTPENEQLKALPKDFNLNLQKHVAYFNQDKHVFTYDDTDAGTGLYINSGNIFFGAEAFSETETELKITQAIVEDNFKNCKNIAELCYKYKNFTFEIVGNTDSVDSDDYNIKLGERRAETIRAIIIQFYKELYPNQPESEIKSLFKRLKIRTDGEAKPGSDNKTPLGRLKNRRVDIYLAGDFDIEKEKQKNTKNQQPQEIKPPKEGNWHVNKEVFVFFLRRQQFLRDLHSTSI